MASLRVGRSISPLLTMHGRFRRGKLERKRHMPIIQNVSLIEETIQGGVEGGRICWKNGERVYLNEALSTLDFRGEAVLGRKEFTSAGFSFGGGTLLVWVSRGIFLEGYKQSAFGSFLM
jgi:hypothetical protein